MLRKYWPIGLALLVVTLFSLEQYLKARQRRHQQRRELEQRMKGSG